MPAKAPFDEKMVFFLTCLKNSNLESAVKIDFDAAGAAYGLNKTQAYKRYWAISKIIEQEGKGPGASALKDSDAVHGDESTAKSPVKKRKGRPPGSGAGVKGKKRKVDEAEENGGNAEENNATVDDDEGNVVKGESEE